MSPLQCCLLHQCHSFLHTFIGETKGSGTLGCEEGKKGHDLSALCLDAHNSAQGQIGTCMPRCLFSTVLASYKRHPKEGEPTAPIGTVSIYALSFYRPRKCYLLFFIFNVFLNLLMPEKADESPWQ